MPARHSRLQTLVKTAAMPQFFFVVLLHRVVIARQGWHKAGGRFDWTTWTVDITHGHDISKLLSVLMLLDNDTTYMLLITYLQDQA